MSLYELSSLLIGLLNFVVVTTALLYYYRQAKAAVNQAKASEEQVKLLNMSLERTTYIEFESMLLDLSKLIIQYPEVRPYLYDDKTCPKKDDKDYNLVISFCVYYLDFFDHVLTTEILSPGGTKWENHKWETWIYDMLKTSPSLRETLNDERHWYDEALYKILENVESKLNIRRSSLPPNR